MYKMYTHVQVHGHAIQVQTDNGYFYFSLVEQHVASVHDTLEIITQYNIESLRQILCMHIHACIEVTRVYKKKILALHIPSSIAIDIEVIAYLNI